MIQKSIMLTRKAASHAVFGHPMPELPMTELPTRPTQSLKNVKTKLTRLMDEGSKASKHGTGVDKSKQFMESLNELFDIAACQCKDLLECNCPKELKVPARERDFLLDQRTVRKMKIGGVDRAVTEMMNRTYARKSHMEQREVIEKKRRIEQQSLAVFADATITEQSPSSSDSCHEETEITPDDYCVTLGVCRNTTPIPTIALEAERYGVSSRAAAAIGTAALVDFGVVSASEMMNVIDPKKVWRA